MLEKQQMIYAELQKKFEDGAYEDVTLGERTFTNIDAYHIVDRLNETFGLCGIGWGTKDVQFHVHDTSVACFGNFWYQLEQCAEFPAVGEARIIKGNTAEAYKKAATNMISKAASFIGVGLSVYQGKGIDNIYRGLEGLTVEKMVTEKAVVKELGAKPINDDSDQLFPTWDEMMDVDPLVERINKKTGDKFYQYKQNGITKGKVQQLKIKADEKGYQLSDLQHEAIRLGASPDLTELHFQEAAKLLEVIEKWKPVTVC